VKKPQRAAARAPAGGDQQHDDERRGGDERHDDPVDRVACFVDLWCEATPGERDAISDLVLEQYLTTASGEDLHDRIRAARRKEVIGALLDRLGVDGLRKVMSPDFGAQLRAAVPHIKTFKTEHAVQTGIDASGKPIFALQRRGGRSRAH
jgi:hypothetical protein